MEKDKEYMDKLRHSAAHLLAAAVLEIWTEAKPTLGPPIENGFYYDFDFGDTKINDEDLLKIEKKMRELLPAWKEFSHREVSLEEAQEIFKGNEYKLELINEIAEKGEKITIYTAGGFSDLCRGGHIQEPDRELKHFKLLSVAGAYWRGDENNPMLVRIYGTAFPTQKELAAYLEMIAEAKRRDHKKLGPELDLFTFSPLVGGGLPLFTPKGTLIRDILDSFVWELRKARGYERVDIPHLTKKELYETSGHWNKFKDELFKITTREGHLFAVKPMNCPHHTQIYARRRWSYRELPQRYASTTKVYRDEQTGELAGLSRVRSITQDDAHVFCRQSQVREEFLKIWDIIEEFYAAAGFSLKIHLSLHDPREPEKYLGTPAVWKKAEAELRTIAKQKKVKVVEVLGEAAFYGPKIDFVAADSLGRVWQVATIQLDMNMPERFNLTCVNENGEKERIVMIHAAIMGSLERYMAILIENFAGAFPVWLSPVQVKIIPISEKLSAYGEKILEALKMADIRAELDNADETLGKRIREAELQKIPYLLIVGEKEEKNGSVNIRKRGTKEQKELSLIAFTEKIKKEIREKLL